MQFTKTKDYTVWCINEVDLQTGQAKELKRFTDYRTTMQTIGKARKALKTKALVLLADGVIAEYWLPKALNTKELQAEFDTLVRENIREYTVSLGA